MSVANAASPPPYANISREGFQPNKTYEADPAITEAGTQDKLRRSSSQWLRRVHGPAYWPHNEGR